MEKQIAEAFAHVKMDEECTQRIRNNLRNTRPAPRWIRCLVATAACLLLGVLLLRNPNVVQALENTLTYIDEAISSHFFPDAIVEEKYVAQDGNIIVEKGVKGDGMNYSATSYATGTQPCWLVEKEDGIYFVGNNENIEISSLISDDIPFTYVFTDDDGIMHYIAIGGIYAPEEGPLAGVAWNEWLRKAEEAENGRYAGWIGGAGMIPNDPNEKWEWLEIAKDEFNVPWTS